MTRDDGSAVSASSNQRYDGMGWVFCAAFSSQLCRGRNLLVFVVVRRTPGVLPAVWRDLLYGGGGGGRCCGIGGQKKVIGKVLFMLVPEWVFQRVLNRVSCRCCSQMAPRSISRLTPPSLGVERACHFGTAFVLGKNGSSASPPCGRWRFRLRCGSMRISASTRFEKKSQEKFVVGCRRLRCAKKRTLHQVNQLCQLPVRL